MSKTEQIEYDLVKLEAEKATLDKLLENGSRLYGSEQTIRRAVICDQIAALKKLLPLALLFMILAGCSSKPVKPDVSAIMPPASPAMYSANSVIVPPQPKEIIIPLSYPQDVTSYTWSIYGAPSVSGPWTLLASNLIGEPAGMMDVPGYGNAGFYKIVSQKL